VNSSSDGQMMSAHPSLLVATVAMYVFYPSLLRYHCSDALVTTGRMFMVIGTYSLLLQYLFVVVRRDPPVLGQMLARFQTQLLVVEESAQDCAESIGCDYA
jgi:hypothetical protein